MTAAEKLSEQAKSLPEMLAAQVLDFMEYLQMKQGCPQPNQTTIDAMNEDDAETVTMDQVRAMCK